MKKSILTLIIFTCIGFGTQNLQAANEIQNSEVTPVNDHKKERMKKIAVFMNLIKKAQDGECHINTVVYYALKLIEDLQDSEDPEDQAACEKLINYVKTLTNALNAAADEAEQEQAV